MESVTDRRNYESQRFYRIRAQAAQAVKKRNTSRKRTGCLTRQIYTCKITPKGSGRKEESPITFAGQHHDRATCNSLVYHFCIARIS